MRAFLEVICIFAVIRGLLYPLLGTFAGSGFVFFTQSRSSSHMLTILDSLAGGIMCAASFFSLIKPAIEQASVRSVLSLLSCSTGFFSGVIAFIFINKFIEGLLRSSNKSENMMFLAVTVHNIPEGMAVGVVLSGILFGRSDVSIASALAMAVGIAVQNIPEGAIISLNKHMRGSSRLKAFSYGIFSALAELLAGVITLCFSAFIYGILPFSLCFAAGAMIYVVLSELSGGFNDDKKREISLFSFASGFVIMMLLDTMLS